VVFGPGAARVLADELAALSLHRALLITTPSLSNHTPLPDRFRQMLGNVLVGICDSTAQHTPAHTVREVEAAIDEHKPDVLISLGGGSVIDTVKAANLAWARDSGTFLPHVSLPTTLSASEFSPLFGVTDEQTKVKAGGNNLFVTPTLVILDAELTVWTPDWLWKSSGFRALDHAVETVYAPDHQPATDAPALEAIRLLFHYLPASCDTRSSLAARQQCQIAAWLSFFGVTNITLGLSHLLGRQIGPRYGVPHGHTSAVLLPKAMEFWLAATRDRQALMAQAMGDAQARPEQAAKRVFDLATALDLPHRLRDLDVPAGDLELLAGGRQDALTILTAAW
jgi:alcohol dehydrogenase